MLKESTSGGEDTSIETFSQPLYIRRRGRLFYANTVNARKAVTRLGIKSRGMYDRLKKQDPHLPSDPEKFYQSLGCWTDWYDFLGKERKSFYKEYTQAQKAAQKIGFSSQSDYLLRYTIDPCLPSRPDLEYEENWSGWNIFLGKNSAEKTSRVTTINTEAIRRRVTGKVYATLSEAQEAVKKIGGITSSSSYERFYSKDSRLPRFPGRTYHKDWISWANFLGDNYKPVCNGEKRAQRFDLVNFIFH